MKSLIWIRSLIFFVFQISTMVFFSLTGQVFWLGSAKLRYHYLHYWARMVVVGMRLICGVKYRVHGLENLDQSKAGIILARHESTWETFAFQEFPPPQSYVLKQELLKIPVFGWGLRLMSPIAIDRGAGHKAMKQVLEQGVEKLKNGFWVVIFPEGTRMPYHKLGRINAGGALLAKKSRAPVYLVAHNAGKVWPSGSFLIQPGLIDVYISPPLDVSDLTVEEINQKTEEWFRAHSDISNDSIAEETLTN